MMPASKKLQLPIFATLPSIGFQQNMAEVVKIRVAPIHPGMAHIYSKVMEVP